MIGLKKGEPETMNKLQKEYLGSMIIANIGFLAFVYTIWLNGWKQIPTWIDDAAFLVINGTFIIIGWYIGITDVKDKEKKHREFKP